MVKDEGGPAYLSIDEKGVLSVRVNLQGEPTVDQCKLLVYGTLKLAEEKASIYFLNKMALDMKRQQEMGILRPDGVAPKVPIKPDIVA